ncbi:MAG: ROK family protein [Planctomycetota bacterium]|nr:MAG: ROK family protein [Planctomycetota bacterium]
MTKPLFGGIEAGGTKFVCAVGTGPDDIRREERFPTTTPEETLAKAIAFFCAAIDEHGPLSAVGIASFGPIDPKPGSPTFGYITTTPKPGWANTDFAGTIGRALAVPVGFDTDVNVAALGEQRWGAGQGIENLIYLTIGTGIGGGGLVGGKLMHGMIHPEMGHVRLPHDRQADPYAGHCPFHGDCFEGLASGPAMADRWKQPAEELPAGHPAWKLEAEYLALALVNFICTLSPERIVIGGGVMSQPELLPMVRKRVQELLNAYVQSPAVLEGIDGYIVAPGLGNRSGVLGAFVLARLEGE